MIPLSKSSGRPSSLMKRDCDRAPSTYKYAVICIDIQLDYIKRIVGYIGCRIYLYFFYKRLDKIRKIVYNKYIK